MSQTLRPCVHCHGVDGGGTADGAFPRLDILSAPVLEAALDAYAEGRRASGIMQPLAGALTDAERLALARHYAEHATRPREPAPADVPPGLARGAGIVTRGAPERGIPACRACHDPVAYRAHALFPSLRGQHGDYIARQLRLFRAGVRGGTAYAGLMAAAARHLSDADIAAVARYYEWLAAIE